MKFTPKKKELEQVLYNTRTNILPRKHKDVGPYYFSEDLQLIMTKQEFDAFCTWMYGQTGAILDGKMAYYASDVGRFWIVRYGGSVLFD